MSLIRSLADTMETNQLPAHNWQSAIECLPELGLSKVIFMDLTRHSAPRVLTNACEMWAEDYRFAVENGSDPFARNCLTGLATQLTGIGHAHDHVRLTHDEIHQIARGSAALDICTGMSVTLHPDAGGAGVGMNLMTKLSASEFAELRLESEDTWRAWSQLVYAGLYSVTVPDQSALLTERQSDCLSYIADGLRTTEVAHKLGLSEATVELHMRNARTRLRAKTRDQAIAIAVRAGLI